MTWKDGSGVKRICSSCRRIQVPFSAPTWCLTTTCNSSSKGFDVLFLPVHQAHRYTQIRSLQVSQSITVLSSLILTALTQWQPESVLPPPKCSSFRLITSSGCFLSFIHVLNFHKQVIRSSRLIVCFHIVLANFYQLSLWRLVLPSLQARHL